MQQKFKQECSIQELQKIVEVLKKMEIERIPTNLYFKDENQISAFKYLLQSSASKTTSGEKLGNSLKNNKTNSQKQPIQQQQKQSSNQNFFQLQSQQLQNKQKSNNYSNEYQNELEYEDDEEDDDYDDEDENILNQSLRHPPQQYQSFFNQNVEYKQEKLYELKETKEKIMRIMYQDQLNEIAQRCNVGLQMNQDFTINIKYLSGENLEDFQTQMNLLSNSIQSQKINFLHKSHMKCFLQSNKVREEINKIGLNFIEDSNDFQQYGNNNNVFIVHIYGKNPINQGYQSSQQNLNEKITKFIREWDSKYWVRFYFTSLSIKGQNEQKIFHELKFHNLQGQARKFFFNKYLKNKLTQKYSSFDLETRTVEKIEYRNSIIFYGLNKQQQVRSDIKSAIKTIESEMKNIVSIILQNQNFTSKICDKLNQKFQCQSGLTFHYKDRHIIVYGIHQNINSLFSSKFEEFKQSIGMDNYLANDLEIKVILNKLNLEKDGEYLQNSQIERFDCLIGKEIQKLRQNTQQQYQLSHYIEYKIPLKYLKEIIEKMLKVMYNNLEIEKYKQEKNLNIPNDIFFEDSKNNNNFQQMNNNNNNNYQQQHQFQGLNNNNNNQYQSQQFSNRETNEQFSNKQTSLKITKSQNSQNFKNYNNNNNQQQNNSDPNQSMSSFVQNIINKKNRQLNTTNINSQNAYQQNQQFFDQNQNFNQQQLQQQQQKQQQQYTQYQQNQNQGNVSLIENSVNQTTIFEQDFDNSAENTKEEQKSELYMVNSTLQQDQQNNNNSSIPRLQQQQLGQDNNQNSSYQQKDLKHYQEKIYQKTIKIDESDPTIMDFEKMINSKFQILLKKKKLYMQRYIINQEYQNDFDNKYQQQAQNNQFEYLYGTHTEFDNYIPKQDQLYTNLRTLVQNFKDNYSGSIICYKVIHENIIDTNLNKVTVLPNSIVPIYKFKIETPIN